MHEMAPSFRWLPPVLLISAGAHAFIDCYGFPLRRSSGLGCPGEIQRCLSHNKRHGVVTSLRMIGRESKAVALSREQEVGKLLDWATGDMGIKAPRVKGGYVDGLRGVLATGDLRPNDEIVTVPSDSALITTTDQRCPFPEWVSPEFWDTGPWIESLPRSFGTPLEWSAADLSELQYPHVEAEVESQRREWTGLFESLKASSPGCGVTQEELNWAMGVAYSRAFSGPYEGRGPKDRLLELVFVTALALGTVALGLGGPQEVATGALTVLIGIPMRDFFITKLSDLKRHALTPVVDLINHKSGIESDVSFNYFYGYFAATTKKPWKVGEQVFISYGSRTNDLLLQRYGFVEADNPDDVYCITGFLDKLESLVGEGNAELLRGAGKTFGPKKVDSVTLGRNGLAGKDEEKRVMPLLRLAAVRDDQLAEDKTGVISLEDFADQVSPANELAARRALLQLCLSERERLPTTLAHDEEIMSSFGQAYGANRRLALAFRVEKKRVLNAAISALMETAKADTIDGAAINSATTVTA